MTGILLAGGALVALAPSIPRAAEAADWQPSLALASTAGPVEAALEAGRIGRGRGAAAGAASGTLEGLGSALDILSDLDTGTSSGPVGGLAVLIGLVMAGIVVLGHAVAGTVAGAMSALPKEEARRIEAAIARTLVRPGLGDELRLAALAYATEQLGPDVRDAGPLPDPAPAAGGPDRAAIAGLAAQGVGTLLVVELEALGFDAAGAGKDPDLVLAARGGYRRIATADGTAGPAQAGLLATAGPHKLAAWTAADGALIARTVPVLLEELARRLVDQALLEVRFEYPG
jgi:hypothetical protein